MEKQTLSQPTDQVSNFKIILAIIISVVATAVIVGGGIYLWRKSSLDAAGQKSQQQIALLQTQIDELHKDNADLKTIGDKEYVPGITTSPLENLSSIEFPIVVYSAGGLLNNTEEGRIEKKNLEEKLIKPYTDYYNEDGIDLVTMNITVPDLRGEYLVDAIFADGVINGFRFGQRGEEYGYWEPLCMGPCDFSEAFKAKYPQIVE